MAENGSRPQWRSSLETFDAELRELLAQTQYKLWDDVTRDNQDKHVTHAMLCCMLGRVPHKAGAGARARPCVQHPMMHVLQTMRTYQEHWVRDWLAAVKSGAPGVCTPLLFVDNVTIVPQVATVSMLAAATGVPSEHLAAGLQAGAAFPLRFAFLSNEDKHIRPWLRIFPSDLWRVAVQSTVLKHVIGAVARYHIQDAKTGTMSWRGIGEPLLRSDAPWVKLHPKVDTPETQRLNAPATLAAKATARAETAVAVHSATMIAEASAMAAAAGGGSGSGKGASKTYDEALAAFQAKAAKYDDTFKAREKAKQARADAKKSHEDIDVQGVKRAASIATAKLGEARKGAYRAAVALADAARAEAQHAKQALAQAQALAGLGPGPGPGPGPAAPADAQALVDITESNLAMALQEVSKFKPREGGSGLGPGPGPAPAPPPAPDPTLLAFEALVADFMDKFQAREAAKADFEAATVAWRDCKTANASDPMNTATKAALDAAKEAKMFAFGQFGTAGGNVTRIKNKVLVFGKALMDAFTEKADDARQTANEDATNGIARKIADDAEAELAVVRDAVQDFESNYGSAGAGAGAGAGGPAAAKGKGKTPQEVLEEALKAHAEKKATKDAAEVTMADAKAAAATAAATADADQLEAAKAVKRKAVFAANKATAALTKARNKCVDAAKAMLADAEAKVAAASAAPGDAAAIATAKADLAAAKGAVADAEALEGLPAVAPAPVGGVAAKVSPLQAYEASVQEFTEKHRAQKDAAAATAAARTAAALAKDAADNDPANTVLVAAAATAAAAAAAAATASKRHNGIVARAREKLVITAAALVEEASETARTTRAAAGATPTDTDASKAAEDAEDHLAWATLQLEEARAKVTAAHPKGAKQTRADLEARVAAKTAAKDAAAAAALLARNLAHLAAEAAAADPTNADHATAAQKAAADLEAAQKAHALARDSFTRANRAMAAAVAAGGGGSSSGLAGAGADASASASASVSVSIEDLPDDDVGHDGGSSAHGWHQAGAGVGANAHAFAVGTHPFNTLMEVSASAAPLAAVLARAGGLFQADVAARGHADPLLRQQFVLQAAIENPLLRAALGGNPGSSSSSDDPQLTTDLRVLTLTWVSATTCRLTAFPQSVATDVIGPPPPESLPTSAHAVARHSLFVEAMMGLHAAGTVAFAVASMYTACEDCLWLGTRTPFVVVTGNAALWPVVATSILFKAVPHNANAWFETPLAEAEAKAPAPAPGPAPGPGLPGSEDPVVCLVTGGTERSLPAKWTATLNHTRVWGVHNPMTAGVAFTTFHGRHGLQVVGSPVLPKGTPQPADPNDAGTEVGTFVWFNQFPDFPTLRMQGHVSV
jgi:hypothetical protein